MDRPPGRGADGGSRVAPHPARRRRGGPARPAGRRGDVPDERPEPGDRGGVPALRDPLPAHRRDALLPAARGQGRAGLPADPPERHATRWRSSGSSTCPARGIGEKTIEAIRRAVAARGLVLGRARGRRGRPGRSGSPPGPGARSPTSPRSSGRCARGSASCPCPSCSTPCSSGRATGRCSPTAPRRARTAGTTCSSCARSPPATTTSSRRTPSTGCSRRPPSSPTRTRTRARPTR